MDYYIVDCRFQDMCSANNDLSFDKISFDIETQDQKCEE